uniref:ArpU family phage packaging/lysis transcriptional regulator n=1 Tax=Streptococcus suis TaxID=1307 RepID=UPI0009A3769A
TSRRTGTRTYFENLPKEIKNRAVEVLKKFGRYQRQAGLTFSLASSGNFSELPKHHPSKHVDKVSDSIVRKVTAEQEVQYYLDAIELLSREEFKYILKNKFIVTDKLSNMRLQYDLQIGETTFFKWYEEALLEFAEAYKNGKILAELGLL